MSKYRVISGRYFPVFGLNTEIYFENSVFSPNTGKYGPEITPHLDTFHAEQLTIKMNAKRESRMIYKTCDKLNMLCQYELYQKDLFEGAQ